MSFDYLALVNYTALSGRHIEYGLFGGICIELGIIITTVFQLILVKILVPNTKSLLSDKLFINFLWDRFATDLRFSIDYFLRYHVCLC